MLARRRNQVTTLGTLLDPIADKLLVAAALVSLLAIDKIDAWIVVVIIGILAATLIPQFMGQTKEAKKNAAKANIGTLQSAVELFNMNLDRYPTMEEGLDVLMTMPADGEGKWRGPYLKKMELDPWQHPYQYKVPGTHHPTSFDLWSRGADGADGGEGDDWLRGGDGPDQLEGGRGNDVLVGNAENDELMGGGGDDWLDEGPGHGMIDGGPGADTMRGGAGSDAFMVSPDSGDDVVLDFQATGLAQGLFDHVAFMDIDASDVTVEDMQALQSDTYSVIAEDLVPVLEAVWATVDTDPMLAEFRDRADLDALVTSLSAWDRRMERGSSDAVVLNAFAFFLARRVLEDDLTIVFDTVKVVLFGKGAA